MADTLYLSLWYPNLRLASLPDKLVAVLEAFAAHGGDSKVYAATVWPVSWAESPVVQHVYGRVAPLAELEAGLIEGRPVEQGASRGAPPRLAVEQALELLHDDYAYEFQIGWSLWELETAPASASGSAAELPPQRRGPVARDPGLGTGATSRWARAPQMVRVTGYGPLFDEGAYEQDGHIRIDFGSDAPFLEEDADLDKVGARHVEENVRLLVELTAAVEKGSGATARLLWSELGESLAQRLAARLGVGN